MPKTRRVFLSQFGCRVARSEHFHSEGLLHKNCSNIQYDLRKAFVRAEVETGIDLIEVGYLDVLLQWWFCRMAKTKNGLLDNADCVSDLQRFRIC